MELVYYRHQSGAVEALRPTHAVMVAAGLGKAMTAEGQGFTAHAGVLAESARRVRDGYRCRTVRKELRRVGLLCVEGVADRTRVEISCGDPDVLKQMAEAAGRA